MFFLFLLSLVINKWYVYYNNSHFYDYTWINLTPKSVQALFCPHNSSKNLKEVKIFGKYINRFLGQNKKKQLNNLVTKQHLAFDQQSKKKPSGVLKPT